MKILPLHSDLKEYLNKRNDRQYRALFIFRKGDQVEIIDITKHYE